LPLLLLETTSLAMMIATFNLLNISTANDLAAAVLLQMRLIE